MIKYQDFIHPEDEAARRQMEAIPGFQTVAKYFIELGVEKMLHGLFMAEKIRLSPTQIWGMVQQNKLDDHAMELIEKALQKLTMARQNVVSGNFCPECGASASGNFCSSCGKKLK